MLRSINKEISLLFFQYNFRILNSDGSTFKIIGSKGRLDGQFNDIRGICVDKEGNYYIADSGNNRIQKFSSEGIFLWKREKLQYPVRIIVDYEGKIIVSEWDSDQISVLNPEGSLIGQFGLNGDGKIHWPMSMALNSSGQLIVCDNGQHRISIFE